MLFVVSNYKLSLHCYVGITIDTRIILTLITFIQCVRKILPELKVKKYFRPLYELANILNKSQLGPKILPVDVRGSSAFLSEKKQIKKQISSGRTPKGFTIDRPWVGAYITGYYRV